MVLEQKPFVLLQTKAPAVEVDSAWESRIREEWLLPCGHWRRPYPESVDVVVKKIAVRDASLAFLASKVFVRLVRAGLYRMLSSVANRAISFGKVFDEQRNPINSWHTGWSPNQIELRGGKESTIQFCTTCGEILYWPWPRESYHVLTNEPGLADVCLSKMGLLVSTAISGEIRKAHLKKLEYYPVQIVESPLDDLPVDLHSLRTTPDKWRRHKFNP